MTAFLALIPSKAAVHVDYKSLYRPISSVFLSPLPLTRTIQLISSKNGHPISTAVRTILGAAATVSKSIKDFWHYPKEAQGLI